MSLRVKTLRDPIYGRIALALEDDKLSPSNLINLATELGDVADTETEIVALGWIASLVATLSHHWRGKLLATDSLSIFMFRLVNEIVGRLSSQFNDKSIQLQILDIVPGLNGEARKIFLSASSHFSHGLSLVEGVRDYIRYSKGRGVLELRDPAYWKNVRRTDEVFQVEVRQHVPDLIRPTLRRSAFCAEDTIWLYAFTRKSYAPHSVSLVSGDIKNTVSGLPFPEAEEKFQVAVAAAELEFHIGRDGEFWLPTLGTSISVRSLFESEGAHDLYEALRAYHAGGLLLIAKKGEITERLYRETFVDPFSVNRVYMSRDEQFAVIEDKSTRLVEVSESGASSGRKTMETEQVVSPFLRRLPEGNTRSARALRLAKEAHEKGLISIAVLRKLEEDRSYTFVSEFIRYEGALEKTLLHELKERKKQ